jgi:hypothetical protein
MNKKTGEPIIIDDKTVTSDSDWFTAEPATGTREMVFSIDAS